MMCRVLSATNLYENSMRFACKHARKMTLIKRASHLLKCNYKWTLHVIGQYFLLSQRDLLIFPLSLFNAFGMKEEHLHWSWYLVWLTTWNCAFIYLFTIDSLSFAIILEKGNLDIIGCDKTLLDGNLHTKFKVLAHWITINRNTNVVSRANESWQNCWVTSFITLSKWMRFHVQWGHYHGTKT